MEESREPGPPPTRSDKYYMVEGDVIVKVENTLFRFHAYHLQQSTTYFDDLLATTPPPPLEADDAGDCSISLDDVKASDFQALLWFYYESGCSWFGKVTSTMKETWKSVLVLAEKFSMQEVAKVACYALHRAGAVLGDVRKISLCVRYDLPKDWMGPQIKSERVDRKLVRRWESILGFATKYAMDDICKVASCALDHHGALSDVRKISLGTKHNIGEAWSQASYASICSRFESLTVQEEQHYFIAAIYYAEVVDVEI
ncbi:hypothetical protein K525DRAFT_271848 [Schizophyllum commune Loenen D]|nr:hypothetical protein K525DRAFT_271848 [Schizophyllum commune Loenen D]